ncbi:MAG: cytochrome c biogenesis protein CcdA [Chloroflexota bacterium]|nr:cytochrome c biogenesis protein CcdA [Chloroflexota bacterium]
MTQGWVDYLNGPWGFAFAFAAGLLSFLSPCVLPLVPAYLAHLTGTAASAQGPQRVSRRRMVTHAATFVAGFTAVFVTLGASAGLIGALFSGDNAYFIRDHQRLLGEIGGVFLIVMGLNLIGVIRIPLLYRTYTLETATARVPAAAAASGGSGGGTAALTMAGGPAGRGMVLPAWLGGLDYAKSFGVGSAFAIGWTPCIGPVLGAILTWSAQSASVARGTYLLLVYSLGLGVPFIITGLAVVPITSSLRRIRGLMPAVEIATGVLVIFAGILLFTGNLAMFNTYFSRLPFLDRLNNI